MGKQAPTGAQQPETVQTFVCTRIHSVTTSGILPWFDHDSDAAGHAHSEQQAATLMRGRGPVHVAPTLVLVLWITLKWFGIFKFGFHLRKVH